MPTRRDFELMVIVVLLIHPALSVVRLWCEKHLATHGGEAGGSAAASVGAELF